MANRERLGQSLLRQLPCRPRPCSRRSIGKISGALQPGFTPKADINVATWFLSIAGATLGIVVVGGITRLTESGLSITEWNVVKGMKWPSSEDEWGRQFELYKQTPEYIKLHHHMDLDQFKEIFYWEWLHRMIGRGIGLATALPAIYFVLRRSAYANQVSRKFMDLQSKKRALGVAGLVSFQGVLGWYMVKSGLEVEDHETPRVSPYRLSAHYGTALSVLSLALWSGMDILHSRSRTIDVALSPAQHTKLLRLSRIAKLATALAFATSLAGALVAGNDAGMVYNTWPLMGRTFSPPLDELLALPVEGSKNPSPLGIWANFFENEATVQFQHRIMAYATFSAVMYSWYRARQMGVRALMSPAHLFAGTCMLQVALGVSTLVYMVPLPLAVCHQTGSVLLVSSGLFMCNRLKFLRIAQMGRRHHVP